MEVENDVMNLDVKQVQNVNQINVKDMEVVKDVMNLDVKQVPEITLINV
jgi:hypothetical protein